MSVLSKAPLPSGDDVRRVALSALAAALEDGKQEKKPAKRSGAMKGVRTVAAGAALYVAGRAAYKNRDAILDQLQDGQQEGDDEPEAEEDDDSVEEDDEEPEAEEDEDFVEEDDEEPEAEEDEDFVEED